jgi:hypothetical protein
MKRFVILAVLLVCQQTQADTYIVVFDSYPSDEGRQVANLLKQDVPKPVHCQYIGHAQATKAVFAKNLRWLKGKAQKGDIAIVYVSAHGSPGTDTLWIGASHGPDVPSSLIRKTTEALPCPSVVLIDTCFAGCALHERWTRTTVVCAVNDHEVSWTGGMSKAVLQEMRHGGVRTIRQFATDLLRRIPACARSQHPVASIGEGE